MDDLIERADRIARDLVRIAHICQRADGTDIPLGQQAREAAALVLAQAAEIRTLRTERDLFAENAKKAGGEQFAQNANCSEVAAIVAWLRCPDAHDDHIPAVYYGLADAIERGEHITGIEELDPAAIIAARAVGTAYVPVADSDGDDGA